MGCDSWAHRLTVHMRTHSHTHMHVCHCGGETVKYSTYLSISTISVTSIIPQVAAEPKQKQRKGKRTQNQHLNMDGKVLIYHSVSQVSNKEEQNVHAASLMTGRNDISSFHICNYWVLSNCETHTVHVGSCGPMLVQTYGLQPWTPHIIEQETFKSPVSAACSSQMYRVTIRTCSILIGTWSRQQSFQRGPTEMRAPVDVATVRSPIHRRRFWCNEIGFNQTTFKWIQMMWLNWGSEGNKASTGDEARVRVRVCARLSQRIVRLISQQPPAETLLHFNIKQLWRKAF